MSKDGRYARNIEFDCRKLQKQREDFIMLTVNKPHTISVFIVRKALLQLVALVQEESGMASVVVLSCLLNQPRSVRGCLPFTRSFRKFRLESKWNTTFRVVRMENFRE